MEIQLPVKMLEGVEYGGETKNSLVPSQSALALKSLTCLFRAELQLKFRQVRFCGILILPAVAVF